MNRLPDYDDQIIGATPFETLFNYRATVGYPFASPSSVRLSSLSLNVGLPRMSQDWPGTCLFDGTSRSLGNRPLSQSLPQVL